MRNEQMQIEARSQKPQARRFVNSVSSFALSLLLLVSSLAFFGVNANAQQQQQNTMPPAQAVAKAVESAPDVDRELAKKAASLVTEFEINGLKVLVKRRAGSQTVAAGLFLRGGARNINAQNAGIEALMWDTATEATANFPRELLRKELARMGTSMTYAINYDYSVLALGSTRTNFDRSWEIFTDAALRPLFAPEDVARVQNRLVIARRDNTDSPDSYLQVLQDRVAYAGHPYVNDPEGSAETIGKLKVEDLKHYHQQMMQTSRLLLVIVGDLDATMLRSRIEQSFGKLPRGDYRPQPLPPLTFNTPTVEITQRSIPTNYIQGVFAAPALTSNDIYPMRVASALLNDRVLVEVRFKRNLSYAPDAFLRDQGANIGGIYVTADNNKANEAVGVMLSEIARLQHEPADPSDIASEVNGYLTKYYMGQETNAAQAGELAMYELIGGGWRNSVDFLERLRTVTPADVQRVAQKYMRNMRFVVIGDPKSLNRNLFTTQTGD